MPFKHEAIEKRQEYYLVNPDLIVIQEGWNSRTDFDLNDLTDSIIENGVQQPLRLRKKENELIIIDGERRLRAVRQAQEQGCTITKIPAIVEKKPISDIAAMFLQLITNDGKVFTPIEEASAYQRLINWGLTQSEIAKRVGRSQAHVSERLKLVNLTPAAQQALLDKDITINQAKEIAAESSVELQNEAVLEAVTRPKKPKKKKSPVKDDENRLILHFDENSECDLCGIDELIEIECMKPIKDHDLIFGQIDALINLLNQLKDRAGMGYAERLRDDLAEELSNKYVVKT